MKVIGTGLSGLVGSRVVELLRDKYQFVDFSLDTGADIIDFNSLKRKFAENKDAETVLHLAAFTDVSAAFKQRGDKNGLCYKVNVQGTENIAKLCSETGKYLIHISTDFVFDGKKETPYTEEDEPHPIEWYGQTKLWAEEAVNNSPGKSVILRLAFPYKAKPSPLVLEPKIKLDLVRNIKQKLENNEKIKLFTDQIITPTFIDDMAIVLDKCLQEKPIGLYHAVGSTSLSPFALGNKIAEAFKLDQNLIEESHLAESIDPRPRQVNMAISNQRLSQALGVTMKTIDEAFAAILATS